MFYVLAVLIVLAALGAVLVAVDARRPARRARRRRAGRASCSSPPARTCSAPSRWWLPARCLLAVAAAAAPLRRTRRSSPTCPGRAAALAVGGRGRAAASGCCSLWTTATRVDDTAHSGERPARTCSPCSTTAPRSASAWPSSSLVRRRRRCAADRPHRRRRARPRPRRRAAPACASSARACAASTARRPRAARRQRRRERQVNVGPAHYAVLSAVLFAIGLFGVTTPAQRHRRAGVAERPLQRAGGRRGGLRRERATAPCPGSATRSRCSRSPRSAPSCSSAAPSRRCCGGGRTRADLDEMTELDA